jgi:hypothetical protein
MAQTNGKMLPKWQKLVKNDKESFVAKICIEREQQLTRFIVPAHYFRFRK